jgi:hypothetical protein
MSKINSQMGKKNDIGLLKYAWKHCLLLSFCRDLIYRSIFSYGVQREMHHQRMTHGKFN